MLSPNFANHAGRATRPRMKGTAWQIRAKEAGLTQRLLAEIAGKSENTVSRQMRGEFGQDATEYLESIILAWERFNAADREGWLADIRAKRTA